MARYTVGRDDEITIEKPTMTRTASRMATRRRQIPWTYRETRPSAPGAGAMARCYRGSGVDGRVPVTDSCGAARRRPAAGPRLAGRARVPASPRQRTNAQYDGQMGLCHEFGSQIRTGCNHPMRAGASACSCAECGVVCRGLFDGCPDVWARGPRPVSISATRASAANGAPSAVATTPGRPGPIRPARPAQAPAWAEAAGDRTAEPAGPRAPTPTPAPSPTWRRRRSPSARDRRAGPAPRTARRNRPAGATTGSGAGERRSRPVGPVGRAGQSDRQAGPDRPTGEQDRRTAPTMPPGDPRREVFRWFEEAFEGVRVELPGAHRQHDPPAGDAGRAARQPAGRAAPGPGGRVPARPGGRRRPRGHGRAHRRPWPGPSTAPTSASATTSTRSGPTPRPPSTP